MHVKSSSVVELMAKLRTSLLGNTQSRNYGMDEPFRSELYNSEQLDNHAQVLSKSHKIHKNKRADLLLKRLDDNERTLLEIRNVLVETVKAGNAISPAAEWLLDNFYLAEEQILIARKHLPKGYSEGLPYLKEGDSAGMPRVYDIVLEIIAHSDGRVDVRNLSSFIASYEQYTILTLGELWAIPIMLRLAVIENLRRVAGKIAVDMIDHNLADYWAERMLQTIKEDSNKLILVMADMVRSKPVLHGPFVAGFTRKLQGKGPSLTMPLQWVEQQLASMGLNSGDIVREENQKQAADQVSIRNSIGTLRMLGNTDWREFVENLSKVEKILREDPAGIYPVMDFATRDNYRHAVEAIALTSVFSEAAVASKAIELAGNSQIQSPLAVKQHHVGYYLIGAGLCQTEKSCQQNLTLLEKWNRFNSRMPAGLYILINLVLWAVLGLWVVRQAKNLGVYNYEYLLLIGVVAFIAVSQLAVSVVNWLVTIFVKPTLLPRMDFSRGIPDAYTTLVVVPTFISSKNYIDELCEALEIRFLANNESNLYFGLLTDFSDANQEVLPEDTALLAYAIERIEALNLKYGAAQSIFFLFHRPRIYNAHEKQWMGYERKRGKIKALNALIKGKNNQEFSHIIGNVALLSKVNYVITLDSDTQLPRDAAWKLIATMAHPLNKAVFDSAKRRVIDGYGILQPRVSAAIPSHDPTLYEKLQGEVTGIDPYTRVSSDVYQDLFGEGSYIGKGIYEVAIFEQAVGGAFQSNRILSHDLLEGCYARAGLVSDVILYEEQPSIFDTEMNRQHRWIRGDWQIGAWMLPFVTSKSGKLIKNKISALSRWKIFDNLRRSLVPVAILVMLFLGWFGVRDNWQFTVMVLAIILLPVVITAIWQLLHQPKELTIRTHLKEVGNYIVSCVLRFVFQIAVLPYEAYKSMSAVWLTNWRMVVTKRKLLQWTPFASLDPSKYTFLRTYALMWVSPALAIASWYLLWYFKPGMESVTTPILTLWLLAPAISWVLGKRLPEAVMGLDDEQEKFLHITARKTWAYFEDFVNANENWLPPDNFQEQPVAAIAHRTSPTNMGLALLANLTAYDFGYISGGTMMNRTQSMLDAMSRLERYRGHFYNWYDTQKMEPLLPKYISSVDSGNLAGHLLTLKQGILTQEHEVMFSTKLLQGLQTHVNVLQELIHEIKARDKEANLEEVQVYENEAVQADSDRSTIISHLDVYAKDTQTAGVPLAATAVIVNDAKVATVADSKNNVAQTINNSDANAKLTTSVSAAIELRNTATILSKISLLLYALLEQNSTNILSIQSQIKELTQLAAPLSTQMHRAEPALEKWIDKFQMQLAQLQTEITKKIPWLDLLEQAGAAAVMSALTDKLSLHALTELPQRLPSILNTAEAQGFVAPSSTWTTTLEQIISGAAANAQATITQLHTMAATCEDFSNIEYSFLFDSATKLFSIGYHVDEQKADNSYYDLLASEARLGIFVAIAQGKIPQESWFSLGRLLTNTGGDPVLLSWSGSMFEYLMPQIIMPSFENTLLYKTSQVAVKRQIEYGKILGIPWGISESAYNLVDANLHYQYKAFGVPGLGLKRGLEDESVIAPYATMLALMVDPVKACKNLQLMHEEGYVGEYGFYEAVDFTPTRLSRGKKWSIVPSFMVHHQGMGLLSLSYALLQQPMQKRFTSELRFQATILLLQEKIPRVSVFYAHTADPIEILPARSEVQVRKLITPHTTMPEVQLLSNGRYQVMVSNAGGGYSRWKDIAVTRWREDGTKDNHGVFCYIRDVNTGNFWSNTYQPTLAEAKHYEVLYSQGHVEFRRSDYGLETKTEIVISPEDDAEMRRVRITNKSGTVKVVEITSYAEIVMASQASEVAHPAFSNLFVQTQIQEDHNAIFCTRRARSEDETPPWLFHHMSVKGAVIEEVSYETDRAAFIGRSNGLEYPQAMRQEQLSGNQGAVLDPIVAIRYRFTLKPNQVAAVDIILGITDTKLACEALLSKYRDLHLKNRAFELSWTHSQVMLRQINASPEDALLYDRLAGSIIYVNQNLRAEPAILRSNGRGQSELWSHSISGDLPIVLLHIYNSDSIDLVRQMIQAHAYWHLKGLAVDLVIWNEDHGSYRQELHDQILGMITKGAVNEKSFTKPGSIYVKTAEQLSSEDRILFASIARVIIYDNKGSLSEQINRHNMNLAVLPPIVTRTAPDASTHPMETLPANLQYFNGTGGFSEDGRAYILKVDKNTTTPAPWVNVLANKDFGTVVSESGSAYTWVVNAHEYRLTPWSNDPISDGGGEAFYIRDEVSSQYWSPTPFPAKGQFPYVITHGFGYTSMAHSEQGIASEITMFVAKDAPVKFMLLKLKNISGKERKLSVTGYMEIMLGDLRSKTNMHVFSDFDYGTSSLLMRNRYNTIFAERVTFFRTDATNVGFTSDRAEFIGRNRSLKNPQALLRKKLSGRAGAGMDPCAALQVKIELLDGEEKTIVFQLGSGANAAETTACIQQFSTREAVLQELQEVKNYWRGLTSGLQVQTPDAALNILANGWLSYQIVACRVFARSGFYQSGGAFGFRDQLQDVLGVLYSQPLLARKQLLLHASRQFTEGDVQHWWHPPEGRGVRTKCSDDLLWLPYVLSRYVMATGDKQILMEQVGYLDGRLLNMGEDSYYDLPATINKKDTVYHHCVRAINHSIQFGVHGLPLIGSGDWNDGMDRVGHLGKGESVWLGFFLYKVLLQFAEIAKIYGDLPYADTCKRIASQLKNNIKNEAWDGNWYLRAWFDNGTPLGSKDNQECRIDAIAQSWSVLSGAADRKHQLEAMASLDKHLVKRDMRLIQLLTPAFSEGGLKPGYIKGYVPGVRENGGQYSHAAIWALMAFAQLEDREKVYELFNLVQPINHALDAEGVQKYKVEPYVMAADVYSNETHEGRGGWTWYTGSAGWMYQFIINSFLGIQVNNNRLRVKPCFPLYWPSVRCQYKYGSTMYNVIVFQEKTDLKSWWKSGDIVGEGDHITLVDDGAVHEVSFHVSV